MNMVMNAPPPTTTTTTTSLGRITSGSSLQCCQTEIYPDDGLPL